MVRIPNTYKPSVNPGGGCHYPRVITEVKHDTQEQILYLKKNAVYLPK